MSHSIAECISAIQRMARIANETDKSLEKLHGIEEEFVSLADPKLHAMFRDVNLGDNALKGFLQQLDLPKLERLQALMYSGRPDEPSAPFLKREFERRGQSKQDIVRAIASKSGSLEMYFARALDRARKENVDIELF